MNFVIMVLEFQWLAFSAVIQVKVWVYLQLDSLQSTSFYGAI